MTPEQTAELAALKAALKQHIEDAEKATPGPWAKDWGRIRGSDCEIIANMPDEDCFDPRWEANEHFIVRARTMSPIACRIALAGIEALEDNYNSQEYGRDKLGEQRLLFILNLWKGGNP